MVALAVCMMVFTVVSVNTFDRSDRSLFGFKAFIVLSDSMSKTDFDAGDLVLVKEVDPSTLKEGDIIAYTSQNTSHYGETVTHKIRKLTTDANGEPGFITYGTTTDTDDETVVTYPYVLGEYKTNIPKVGRFFMFLKTTPGYIVCILIPFLLLILLEGIRCIRLLLCKLCFERKQLRHHFLTFGTFLFYLCPLLLHFRHLFKLIAAEEPYTVDSLNQNKQKKGN